MRRRAEPTGIGHRLGAGGVRAAASAAVLAAALLARPAGAGMDLPLDGAGDETPHGLRERLPEMVGLPETAVGAVSVGLGLILCFWGARVYRISLGILGFALGAAALGAAGLAFGGPVACLVAGLVGGLIGAALLYGFYTVGVFLLGAALGEAALLAALMPISPVLSAVAAGVVVVIAAAVGGVLALWLHDPVIVLATAVIGGLGVAFGVASLAGYAFGRAGVIAGRPSEVVFLVLAMVLIVAGVVVQLRARRRPAPPKA